MARNDDKTSADRVKILSGGDTGDRLAEVDGILGCLVVQTVKHYRYRNNSTTTNNNNDDDDHKLLT